MTASHHTPYATGAALTHTELDRPIGELDAALVTEAATARAAEAAEIVAREAAIVAEALARAQADAAEAGMWTGAVAAEAARATAAENAIILSGSGVSTTLDGSAASGQKVIPLTATTGITAGMTGYVTDGTNAESVTVASVSAGVSVTAVADLVHSYVSGDSFSVSPVELVQARGGYATIGGRLDHCYGAVASTQRLMKKLYRGDSGSPYIVEDAVVVILGDSTAGNTGAWPSVWAPAIAAQHPAWTVKYAAVDIGATGLIYDSPTTLQTGTGPNTLWIWNAAVGGKNIGHHIQNLDTLVTAKDPDLVIIAHGHNELGYLAVESIYRDRMLELTEAVLAGSPLASICIVLQNPRTNTGANLGYQAIEHQAYMAVAALRGFGVIDVWQAFWATGDPAGLTSDGIHPTTTGYALWSATMMRHFVHAAGMAIPAQPQSTLLGAPAADLLVNGDLSRFNGTVALLDRFNRTTASGWGTPPTGAAWSVEAGSTSGDFATDGSVATIAIASAPNTDAIVSAISLKNQSAVCSITLDKLPVGATYTATLRLRYVDAANFYRAILVFGTTGSVNVQLIKRVATVETTLVAQTLQIPVGAYVAGRKLWVRAEVSGAAPQSIGIRAWLDGQPEPAAWTISATETEAALNSAAGFAIGCRDDTSESAHPVATFDDLAVSDASDVLVGWSRSGVTLAPDHANGDQSGKGYGLRLLASGAALSNINQVLTPAQVLALRGQWITLAARIRVAAATATATGGRIAITDNGGGAGVMSEGAQHYDGWYWSVVSWKVGASATIATAWLYADSAANANADATYDRAILVRGILPRDIL